MQPILYSFRRCPYAMRARLAIAVSQQQVSLREIILKNKPAELLAISPNKTIPVLQLNNLENTAEHQTTSIIEDNPNVLFESLEIMVWALEKNDPQGWLNGPLSEMLLFIDHNDFAFKPWLDKYKYADRYIENDKEYYRENAEEFLMMLEARLRNNQYLFGEHITLTDMAIFPFIRQFASVDQEWFEQSPYLAVQKWLDQLVNGDLFAVSMKKYPTWLVSGEAFLFPNSHV